LVVQGVIPDGSYLIGQSPTCGNVTIDGSPLVVQGDTASIAARSLGSADTGTITYQSPGFDIHVNDGTVVTIDLTDTGNAQGALMGSGQTGSNNPGGGTGWVCNFQRTRSGRWIRG
jgi:hypothetical protein